MAAVSSTRKPFSPAVQQLNPEQYLPFVPQNESGVVYVFALAAVRMGFEVQKVQIGFPDCVAKWGGKRVRIEFEFRSKNFENHGHDARRCDLIVCWKHDWARAPSGLKVLEMRKLFGLARDTFVIAYRDELWTGLPAGRQVSGLWSVPSTCGPDDLLLVYRPQERGENEPGAVTDVFRVVTAPERIAQPAFRDEPDWMAPIQRVASLREPIPFPRLRQLGAHGGIESRPRRTKQWPALYRTILDEGHPTHSLKRYAPLDS